MNALAHALASGEAHAIETASVLGSVHAKIRKSEVEESREEKSREKYRYSPSIHSVTYVTRGTDTAPIVTPSQLAHPDAMDGLTIPLSDLPGIDSDGLLCETALHCDSAIPADYLVQFIDPVLVDEWGDFVWPICAQCHRRGSQIEGDVEAWRIVRVLR